MRHFACLAFVIACGGHHPSDLGTCQPFERGGKAYYLCERTGATPAQARKPATDSEQVREAELARDEAIKAAQEAAERVERLSRDLEDHDKRLTAAVESIVAAQNDADRASARAKLEALRREKADMEARIAATKAAAARVQRQRGMKITNECLDNPLAKGCD